jgi:hypothetical protein
MPQALAEPLLNEAALRDHASQDSCIAATPAAGLLSCHCLSCHTLLPADASAAAPTGQPAGAAAPPQALEPDALIVSQLVSMGFSENGSRRAALAVRTMLSRPWGSVLGDCWLPYAGFEQNMGGHRL